MPDVEPYGSFFDHFQRWTVQSAVGESVFVSSVVLSFPMQVSTVRLFFSLSFVSDVINIYYSDDEAVQEDEEIQGFIKDACSFGMQDFDQCGGLCRRDLTY